MDGQTTVGDVFSGEPVPLWAEERTWPLEVYEIAEEAIEEEEEEEEEGGWEGLPLLPAMSHSDEEAAVAILAGVAALAFLFLSGSKGGNNNAE